MANQYPIKTEGSVPLDDLVRRKLRVGDPRNPVDVAKALLDLYPEEKVKLEREAAGLPFVIDALQVSPISPMVVISPTESDFAQAKADLDQDLNILVSEPALRNVAGGLRGWAQSVRKAIAEGMGAARLALDPGQRDKVFGIRRILGDYARLARYVGVLNIESNFKYRRLARSIDQVASLIFVQMGEAISKQAMSGFLLQVSLSEMQARQAGVINALRNLLGSIETAYDDETWGRGRIGYRLLYDEIEERNQPDLRVLLQESELSRMMNELVDIAARNTADGLSALGATAAVTIEKMQRLLAIGDTLSLENPQPPLVAFLESLHLFVDAFVDTRVGLRLVDIARPPITFYGSRYGIGMVGIDIEARETLVDLTFERGRLADALDDYLQDDFSNERIIVQVVLDEMLYDVDRAIDLYAQGTEDWGVAEQRAVAYAILIAGITKERVDYIPDALLYPNPPAPPVLPDPDKHIEDYINDRKQVKDVIGEIQDILSPDNDDDGGVIKNETLSQEFTTQKQAEERWLQLVQAVVPSNFP